jgi:hypothetical protein
VSKTGVRVKSHTREKDDLALEKKGFGKNLRKKSGILKGVSARYKTKKVRKHAGFSYGGGFVCEGECHIFGRM